MQRMDAMLSPRAKRMMTVSVDTELSHSGPSNDWSILASPRLGGGRACFNAAVWIPACAVLKVQSSSLTLTLHTGVAQLQGRPALERQSHAAPASPHRAAARGHLG